MPLGHGVEHGRWVPDAWAAPLRGGRYVALDSTKQSGGEAVLDVAELATV